MSGRGRREERVPLDALVELRSENGDEVMEADGLDLGPGGLSMRAPFVPEPGVRLVCHFRCPPLGEPVQAHSEVVWSAWEGPRSGAFGVRFLELDTRGAMAIRRFLSPESEDIEAQQAKAPPPRTTATMVIDGLAAPIEADLRLFDEARVVLEQELTFLRLGRGVEVDVPGQGKQRGRIASVELRPGPLNVPTLVFGVLVDQPQAVEAAPAPVRAQVASLPRVMSEEEVAPLAAAMRASDETNIVAPAHHEAAEAAAVETSAPRVIEASPAAEALPTMIVEGMEAPSAPSTTSVDTWPERPIFSEPAANDAAPSARTKDRTETFKIGPSDDTGPLSPEDHAEVDAFSKGLSLQGVVGGWRSVSESLGAVTATLRTLFTMLRTLFVRYVGEHLALTFRRLNALLSSRAARNENVKQRTTAPAPRVVQKAAPTPRETRSAEAKPKKPRNHRLSAMALAVVGLGLGVYALAPRSGAARLNQAPLARTESSQSVALLPSAGSTEPSAPLSVTAPSTAPAAPETNARVAAPVSIGSGPTQDQLAAPANVASSEQDLAKSFGAADVTEGRSFVLRMSGPVEGIEGDARADGFTVRVPGRLALDRASPIATSHRAVARAMILNRGDYAELTVDFLPGMHPKYRVTAKDNAIEVTLERL